jgi:steroid 5-alpha reductase family enzyme
MTSVIVWSAAAATAAMLALWARQLRTSDATSVDVGWTLLVVGLAVTYAVAAGGDPWRRLLVGGLAALWGLRLAFHLMRDRVLGGRGEDARYRELRERWGPRAPRNFLFLHLAQVAFALLFSVPLLAAMRGGPLDGWALGGALVWVVAVVGEALADRQLAAFRADPQNRGEVCRAGVWRYSRHPNYFFEWLHWWTYVLIAHAAPLAFLGPVVMLVFLFRLTGIPYTERQALRTRGEKYRAYQQTTSVFVPWPPRRSDERLDTKEVTL